MNEGWRDFGDLPIECLLQSLLECIFYYYPCKVDIILLLRAHGHLSLVTRYPSLHLIVTYFILLRACSCVITLVYSSRQRRHCLLANLRIW